MNIEEKIFCKSTIAFDKLKKYGFKKSNNLWTYCKNFQNGDFKAVINVDISGNVSGDVYDTNSEDIYFPLRVESMDAGFAGEVRAKYCEILQDIRDKCCNNNFFIQPQANRLMKQIYKQYGDSPAFPWESYSAYGVFKNPESKKWYALIMNINKNKLDQKLDGEIEVVNIKLKEDKVSSLLKENGFYPAYHMNKKSWITITLDDTISDDFLYSLVDESYSFTQKKKKKQ